MADVIFPDGDESVKIKYKDNGDGSYSPYTDISLKVPSTFKTLKAVTITSIATVWTPASGKKVRLMGGSISVSAAVSVLFEDNSAGTDVYQTPKLAVDSPYSFDLGNGVLLGAINSVLKATSSAAATITGTLYGIEE
jgi:hypothetical protein